MVAIKKTARDLSDVETAMAAMKRTPKTLLFLFGVSAVASLILVFSTSRINASFVVEQEVQHNSDQTVIEALPKEQPAIRKQPQPQQQVIQNKKKETDEQVVYYSIARTDRSGASIWDMLTAHAYAFSLGGKYGGACRKEFKERDQARDADKLKLLKDLGVLDILPYNFTCPPKDTATKVVVSNNKLYRNRQYVTDEWLAHIRSKIQAKLNLGEFDKGHKVKTIVAHIRRGDIDACAQHHERYLPNRYFLEVLSKLKQDYTKEGFDTDVTIFTETEWQTETDEIFNQTGYNIDYRFNLAYIWRVMIAADVLVMSRSSFCTVPAMLNGQGRMIYPIYNQPLMSHWEYAPHDILMGIADEREAIQEKHCPDREFARKPVFDPTQNQDYLFYMQAKYGVNMSGISMYTSARPGLNESTK